MITLDRGPHSTFIVKEDSGQSILVQTDCEYPGIASTFGWVPCWCGETDGTVDCPHRKTADMIADARQWLDDHIGMTAEDPGYFT
jgi:hypothetical protein